MASAISLRTLLEKHSYDLVIFLPKTRESLTVNLWADNESQASARAIAELGGVGHVQILRCEHKGANHSGRRQTAGKEC